MNEWMNASGQMSSGQMSWDPFVLDVTSFSIAIKMTLFLEHIFNDWKIWFGSGNRFCKIVCRSETKPSENAYLIHEKINLYGIKLK